MTELQEKFEAIDNESISLREAYKNAYLASEYITDGDIENQLDKLPFTFFAYQNCIKWTAQFPKHMPSSIYCAIGLSGELGETINVLKKVFRDNDGVLTDEVEKKLKDEIGDCLWYIVALINELDLDFEDVARNNQKKLLRRLKKNVIHGSGDNR